MANTRKPAANARTRRAVQTTKHGSNALNIQRTINRDYSLLLRDYSKLFTEIWRKPVTKYILGGVAFTALVPVLLRNVRRIPAVETFMADNVDNLNLDEIRSKVTSTIGNFRSESSSASLSDDMTDIQ